MKFRKGFVTNSSSSSFICEVCQYSEGGYDLSLSECDMIECENGHVFCSSHLIIPNRKTKIQYIKRNCKKSITLPFNKVEDDELDNILKNDCQLNLDEQEDFSSSDYPSLYCPICNLDYIPEHLKIQYILKKYAIKEFSLNEEIQNQFNDEKELMEYIKNK